MTRRSYDLAANGSSQSPVDPRVNRRVGTYAAAAQLGPVAMLLRERRDEILSRWLEAARQQPFHANAPDRAVADHMPRLFDAIAAFLQRSGSIDGATGPPLQDEAVHAAARAHAQDRFAQGLTPADVLTEFRLLRQEVGRALREGADGGVSDLLGAELLVHDALDGATTLAVAALEAHDAEQRRLRGELAAIVDSSSDAILAKTLEGVITSWNPAAEHLYGYTASEAIGHSVSLIIPPERQDELPRILERIRRGERVQPYLTERVRRDGVHLPVSVTISPIKDNSGAVIGASAIARDVSEQIR